MSSLSHHITRGAQAADKTSGVYYNLCEVSSIVGQGVYVEYQSFKKRTSGYENLTLAYQKNVGTLKKYQTFNAGPSFEIRQ